MSTAVTTSHPAAYTKPVLDALTLWIGAERRLVGRPLRICDVFAGIGRIHDLPKRFGETVGVEIESAWANCRAGTIVGDATDLPADWTETFDVIATSPVFANRMSDHHEAKDSCFACKGIGTGWSKDGCGDAPFLCPDCSDVACKCGGFARVMKAHNRSCPPCSASICKACKGDGLSRRYTYRAALGRPLQPNNAGQMQWGEPYRELHSQAWAEAYRVLRPGGLCIVDCKNHVRGGVEMLVTEWHTQALRYVGFRIDQLVPIPAPGLRDGANGTRRVDVETIIVGRKP